MRQITEQTMVVLKNKGCKEIRKLSSDRVDREI